MIKNLVCKSLHYVVSGAILGTLLATPTWAMDIPDDVLSTHIFTKLTPTALRRRASQVCKQWNRVSKHVVANNQLWKSCCTNIQDETLQKRYLKLPLTMGLTHVKALFEQGYISRNGLIAWKVVGKDQDPEAIIKGLNQPNVQWGISGGIGLISNADSVQHKTNLLFVSRVKETLTIYKEVPCTLTLKRSLSVEKSENSDQGCPYFPCLSDKRLKKILKIKQYRDLRGRVWEVKQDQDLRAIKVCIDLQNPHDIGALVTKDSVYYPIKCIEFDETTFEPYPREAWPVRKLTLEKQ